MASHITSAATFAQTVAVTGAFSAAASVAVGGGTAITKIVKGTVTVDPADLASVTAADKDITIAGAAVGDMVILHPPATALTAGFLICQAWVSATDTVTVRFYNASGGAINIASGTWAYCLIRS